MVMTMPTKIWTDSARGLPEPKQMMEIDRMGSLNVQFAVCHALPPQTDRTDAMSACPAGLARDARTHRPCPTARVGAFIRIVRSRYPLAAPPAAQVALLPLQEVVAHSQPQERREGLAGGAGGAEGAAEARQL